MRRTFKSPLTIYAIWHPEYTEGRSIADELFNVFSRRVNDPFARTPGIPVQFRSVAGSSDAKLPGPIPFDESDHTAMVVLVDDHMVVDDDWRKYIAALDATTANSSGKMRLFPVAVNHRSFAFPLASTNFIRLFDMPPAALPASNAADDASPAVHVQQAVASSGPSINIHVHLPYADSMATPECTSSTQVASPSNTSTADGKTAVGSESANNSAQELAGRKAKFVTSKLVHELSRLLYHRPRTTKQGTVQSAPPIRLFISHAKEDGRQIAESIRGYINSDTSLKSFFDANDIAAGYRFPDELKAALEESTIVCLQTDYYATREWCLWEVIFAKRLNRPMVVVNAITDREPRSFPYLGNVPTVRWVSEHRDHREQIQRVLDITLFEVLGTRYHELLQRELIDTFGVAEKFEVSGRPPELFAVLKESADETPPSQLPKLRYVIYPDPPLGDVELRLLEEIAPRVRFTTPTMLPLVKHQLRTD